jgi:hypothetical protein
MHICNHIRNFANPTRKWGLQSTRRLNCQWDNQSVSRAAGQSVSVMRSVSQAVSQVVGQLVRRLVGRSVGGSVGRWVGRSVGRSVSQSVSQSANQSASQSAIQAVAQSVSSLVLGSWPGSRRCLHARSPLFFKANTIGYNHFLKLCTTVFAPGNAETPARVR